MPPNAVRADEDHFERCYGSRYAEQHLYVRLLDPQLKRELGFPCLDFSLPLPMLSELSGRPAAVFIVENKVNLLTLPSLDHTLGLGALSRGVSLLRYVPWLNVIPIVYWGDLDVQGFEILSWLRTIFPQTRSILMDQDTPENWRHLYSPGNRRRAQGVAAPH